MLVVLSTTIAGGDMYTLLHVTVRWLDEPFGRFDAVIAKASGKLPIDVYDKLMDDDSIFYVIEEHQRVIGKHLDFEILTSEVY